ncbi:MAG: hypothetical protein ABFD25_16105 [Clostridiaceae bacterium]
MISWMKTLSDHYKRMRECYPDDQLMILFDIDGTIVDTRYTVHDILKRFDKWQGTSFFSNLEVDDISFHEKNLDQWIERLGIHENTRTAILRWYKTDYWSTSTIMSAHRPFAGVMDVIRWFQIQPNTHVGLNTGRNESARSDTLRALNQIGKEYRVEFRENHLYMSPYPWGENIVSVKVEGVRHFLQKGYRVCAFIDNEPENLLSVASMDNDDEILLLHADTIFASKRRHLPARAIGGSSYDITELAQEEALPRHVQFVWHAVNDHANLRQFLISNIQWAECDVRINPLDDTIILRHYSFAVAPLSPDEQFLTFQELLTSITCNNKNIKIDFKESGRLTEKVFELLAHHHLSDDRLWFSGRIEKLQENGFRKIAQTYPNSIIQCPIDFLAPLVLDSPAKAYEILKKLTSWGINRFSLKWKTPHLSLIVEIIEQWGFRLNIYNVPDLESFLKAVLLLPCSITSDFNFPKWHYTGHGCDPQRRFNECNVGYLAEQKESSTSVSWM